MCCSEKLSEPAGPDGAEAWGPTEDRLGRITANGKVLLSNDRGNIRGRESLL